MGIFFQARKPFHRNKNLFHVALPRNQPFISFSGESPLILAQKNDIPVNSLKIIPHFIGETSITLIEHIIDVANICSVHDVIEKNVVVRLLVTSLKGKELQWYRVLPPNTINNWDRLGEKLCKKI